MDGKPSKILDPTIKLILFSLLLYPERKDILLKSVVTLDLGSLFRPNARIAIGSEKPIGRQGPGTLLTPAISPDL